MFAEFTEALFSIFFIETLINGLLLGGVLALLSLGLNLIFGVIDVVWICYAEIIMLGMYTIYFLHVDGEMPLLAAAACGVGVTALLGWLTHRLVIGYLLDAAPINQLLATGGLLFFFQGAAMVVFGVEFRNLGVSLGSLALSEDIYLSWTRLLSFAIAGGVVVVLFQFLSRSYLGAAIRAISQDREIMILMGVDTKKLYLLTSAIGGGLAGLASSGVRTLRKTIGFGGFGNFGGYGSCEKHPQHMVFAVLRFWRCDGRAIGGFGGLGWRSGSSCICPVEEIWWDNGLMFRRVQPALSSNLL